MPSDTDWVELLGDVVTPDSLGWHPHGYFTPAGFARSAPRKALSTVTTSLLA